MLFPRSLVVVLLATALLGCGGPEATPEPKGGTHQKMVGGTISPTTQDATVLLIIGNEESCSGSLIAPNLVLTARHCVAEPQGDRECSSYGPTRDPGSILVFLGARASGSDPPAAAGAVITVPQTSNMCSFDVALVQLDQNINGRLAPLRFTELAPNEPTVAVGYGVDGNNNELPSRMQRSTTVLGVGPKAIQYQPRQGSAVSYNIPLGDLATGESTCYGDSGGPLLDALGQVVGVTSRGIDVPDDGTHGNGCVDLPSVYAGVRFNEQVIRAAARAAGHELPPTPTMPTIPTPGTVTPPVPGTGTAIPVFPPPGSVYPPPSGTVTPAPTGTVSPTTPSPSATASDGSAVASPAGPAPTATDQGASKPGPTKAPSSSSSESESENDKPTKTTAPPAQGAYGCSAAHGRVPDGSMLFPLAALVMLGTRRVRRRREA